MPHGPSLLAIIALTSCAPRTPPVVPDRAPAPPSARAIVDRAVLALGGATRIASVRMLTVEGSGTIRSFGQSVVPGSDLPIVDISHIRRTIDLASGRWREQLTQARRPPSPNTIPVTYALGVAGAIAYTIDDDGAVSLDPPSDARERRAELLHNPLSLLRAALAPGAVVTNARRSLDRDLVDVVTMDGTYTLAVDVRTGLAASIASWIDDPVLGPGRRPSHPGRRASPRAARGERLLRRRPRARSRGRDQLPPRRPGSDGVAPPRRGHDAARRRGRRLAAPLQPPGSARRGRRPHRAQVHPAGVGRPAPRHSRPAHDPHDQPGLRGRAGDQAAPARAGPSRRPGRPRDADRQQPA